MHILQEDELNEIRRRGALAGGHLDWSRARQRAFATTIAHYNGEIPDTDPASFGFRYGAEARPGLDEDMSIDKQMAFGRYDAAKTLKAWMEADQPGRPIEALDYARYWMDREGRGVPADAEMIDDMSVNEIVMTNWGAPEILAEWFIAEHEMSLRHGGEGYQRLLLEPIRIPIVLEKGECTFEIIDGWHRTAAMALVGDRHMKCVVCHVETELIDEPGLR